MDDQGAAWASLSNGLLAAGIAHGWAFVVGVLSILLITNLAAYILVTTMIKNHGSEVKIVKIKTPFLAITIRPNRPERKKPDDGMPSDRATRSRTSRLPNPPSQESNHSTLN
jgi:hypothetical protein